MINIFSLNLTGQLDIKKNQILVDEGDETSYLYYLKSGFVRICVFSKEGKELTVYIINPNGPGSYLPLISTFVGTPNIYSYECLTNVEILRILKIEATAYLQKHQDIYAHLAQMTLERLDIISRRLINTNLSHRNSTHLLSSALLALACPYGDKNQCESNKVIQIPLTHKIIGTLAGLSRESTSIELKKLERSKIISQNKHQIIIENFMELQQRTLSTLSSSLIS